MDPESVAAILGRGLVVNAAAAMPAATTDAVADFLRRWKRSGPTDFAQSDLAFSSSQFFGLT